MICQVCEGWGNPEKKRDWVFNEKEACKACGGSGQIPSNDDQTFIVTERNEKKISIFAVQGNWRKELLGEVVAGNKKHLYKILEKIRQQPNVKIAQARLQIIPLFKLAGGNTHA